MHDRPVTDVRSDSLLDLIEAVLARHRAAGEPQASAGEPQASAGPDASDIRRAAFWLVQAELLELPAFGLQMLLRDLERLDGLPAHTSGARAPMPLAIDAARTPGPVAMALAVRRAAQAVRAHGSAVIGLRNVGALGVLGCAARSLAAEGVVAIVSANASAFVAPWGGSSAAIGTNPLAVAAPRLNGPPLVVDFSTSPMTMAGLRQARATGGALPPSGAVDRHGQRTAIPMHAAALLPEGRIASLTGLALELLTGVGVGGRLPAGSAAPERTALLVAYAPEAMGNADAAALCAQFVNDWTGAGGHVPSRFDVLPFDPEHLPVSVAIASDTLAALRARR